MDERKAEIKQKINKEKDKKTLRVQIISAVSVLVTFVAVLSGISTYYLSNKSAQDCLAQAMPATAQQASQIVSKEINRLTDLLKELPPTVQFAERKLLRSKSLPISRRKLRPMGL